MPASQVEGWVFDPQPLSVIAEALLGKKRSPIAITKINKKKVSSPVLACY